MTASKPVVDQANVADETTVLSDVLEAGGDTPAVRARLASLRGQGESLRDLALEWRHWCETLGSESDAAAAMGFMRGELARRRWPFEGSAAAAYGRLLEGTRNYEIGRRSWTNLGGQDSTPPPDLPERLAAMTSLTGVEDGVADRALADMLMLKDVRDERSWPDRVRDFERVTNTVSAEGGAWRMRFYDWYTRALTPPEREPYLRVQAVAPSFSGVREAWEGLRRLDDDGRTAPQPLLLTARQLDERASTLARYVAEVVGRVHPVVGRAMSTELMAALLGHRRHGETLEEAAQSLDTWRAALPGSFTDLPDAVDAFSFARDHVAPEDEPLFARTLGVARHGAAAGRLWDALLRTGARSSLGARLEDLATQDEQAVTRVVAVADAMPVDVDVERAAAALLLAERDYADGAQRASGMFETLGGDRTVALEAACRLVGGARDEETLRRAWEAVSAPEVPGTIVERADVVGRLLGASRDSRTDALTLAHELDGLPTGEYLDASNQAIDLLTMRRDHAAEAAAGLARLVRWRRLDSAAEVPLRHLFDKYGVALAMGASVDEAVLAAEREARNRPATIEHGETDLIIGGVRIPRR